MVKRAQSDKSPPDTTRVAIDLLRRGDSPRSGGENREHVELLAQTNLPLPPILVHRGSMRVLDGMHRLHAAELRGETTIDVVFFDGDDEASFIEAVRANRAHGLPLTLSDRQSAAERILAAKPALADRTIAQITGLATRTVAAIRERVAPDDGSAVRIGRDGRRRPTNSAVGRRIASETISERPDASLRDIARAAGISLGTARDVRERIRRGEDPVPPTVQRAEYQSSGQRRGETQRRGSNDRSGWSRRDQHALLRTMANDPALRLSEAGRAMLRWLCARVIRMDGWKDIVSGLPPHSAYVVAEIARNCGQEWFDLAAEMERRAESAA